MLPVAATCAAAGMIVAVVTLTGLGLKASSLIVGVSGGVLAVTALMCALAVLLLGLAVPVTASFVIAAVIIAPALKDLGVSDAETYMFIFYYAVLSEVSPPTALSAFAASAITGGNAYRTMLATWKYTLPAFLVPFAFVLTPAGAGLLAQGSAGRSCSPPGCRRWPWPRWPRPPAAGRRAGPGRPSGRCAARPPSCCCSCRPGPCWPGRACSSWRRSSTWCCAGSPRPTPGGRRTRHGGAAPAAGGAVHLTGRAAPAAGRAARRRPAGRPFTDLIDLIDRSKNILTTPLGGLLP
nr:hypothetical protein GCM10020093_033630 [Planobispora longispora]